jgi:hypothetical protein
MSSSDTMSASKELLHFVSTIEIVRGEFSSQEAETCSKLLDVETYINSVNRKVEYDTRSLTNFDEFGRLMLWDPVKRRFLVVCGQRQAQALGFLEDHDIR